MGWFVAPAITKLNQEIQARWPGRDTATDGVIGDASHAARPSDHNPCWTCSGGSYGIVRASDRDDDGWPAIAFRDWLIDRCRRGLEHRLAYLIHNRTIWSATYGWTARHYTGTNSHESHIHFSLKRDGSNFDTRPWLAGYPADHAEPAPGPQPAPQPEGDDDVQFIVNYQGIWLVKGDLSSRTGFSSMADVNAVRTKEREAQYPIIVLSPAQMARIPVAGTTKVDLSDEDLAQAAKLNAAEIDALDPAPA